VRLGKGPGNKILGWLGGYQGERPGKKKDCPREKNFNIIGLQDMRRRAPTTDTKKSVRRAKVSQRHALGERERDETVNLLLHTSGRGK